MNEIKMSPVGIVRSTRSKLEDDNWDSETMRIELVPSLSEEALLGLADFSHAEIIFFMDQVEPSKIEKTARHPRNNTGWPRVGIFAQRGKNRPNQIGTTIFKILKVEKNCFYLEGLDAVNCTPVLDIKPWV